MQFTQNITDAAVAVAFKAVKRQCGVVDEEHWQAIGLIAAALVSAAMRRDGSLQAELHEMPDDYPHRGTSGATIPSTEKP